MVVATGAPIKKVIAAVQNYEWGLQGSSSLVAKLAEKNSGEKIDESKPYAELWMGTHPNAPCKVKTADGFKPLKEFLPSDLSFLFKVLSVGQALSIQAHPDIELAKKLHAQDPKNYRDPNHKPEMTIALTPFEALCGFRPLREIVKFTEEVPELVQLVDPERVTALKEVASSKDEDLQKKTLKEFFARFITADKQLVKECITAFMNRLTSANRSMTELEDLCLRLNSQYPDEVGCFCVFILNYIEMEPGEAIFLAANEPHAYLSGECMECMAMSDNVVRAGLTPKFRDVETLVEMLTYKTYKKENLSMHPKQFSKHSLLFKPPVKEFAVIKTKLSLGEEETLKTEASDSILICIKGDMKIECSREEMAVSMGDILLLDANSDFKIISQSAESLLFLAFSQS